MTSSLSRSSRPSCCCGQRPGWAPSAGEANDGQEIASFASFLVLFAATIVSLAAHAFMPTDVLPVVAVGVIFPFLLVGQLAIDWRQLGINAPSV
jgi:hypothetical protein